MSLQIPTLLHRRFSEPMNPAIHLPAKLSAESCAACARNRHCAACFEELVRRFQTPLLHFLTRRGNLRHDAEDLVQETFLLAYRNLEKFDSSRSFNAWIFTIAHRQALSSRRRRRRPYPLATNIPANSPSAAASPQDAAQAHEFRAHLWDAAQRLLNTDSFTALWLAYVESMSADEIGVVLGRNANAVRIVLHRARAHLAEHLSPDLKPPGAMS